MTFACCLTYFDLDRMPVTPVFQSRLMYSDALKSIRAMRVSRSLRMFRHIRNETHEERCNHSRTAVSSPPGNRASSA